MVNRVILICIALFIAVPNAHALEVQATVDKNPIIMDEAITLTVVATGSVNRNAFNPSVLLKDFVVGNTSVSSQTRIVNFDKTKTTTWQTTLFPKKVGRFTIPSLTVENASTRPIDINVISVPDNTTNETRDYFVTAQLSTNSVYVQQHVNYVVKLHMAQSIERGSLQTPSIDNSSIEQVGEDNQYSDIINGKRFQIIERTFVIVPEKSGKVIIQPPIFAGEVLASNSSQRYGAFNRTQSVTRRGPQLTLNVNPIPTGYDGHWLPSEYVELAEEWSNDSNFVVGEPITRTLTLTVAGQNKAQLPEIEQLYPPFVKHYPDQPSTASASKDGIIVSQRQESTAIIPSKVGPMVIPGTEVTWFNVKTGKTEIASLPARSFNVKPAPQDSSLQTQTPQEPLINADNTSPTIGQSTISNTEQRVQDSKSLVIWQIIAGILACLWLITLYLLWRVWLARKEVASNGSASKKNTSNVAFSADKTNLTSINSAIDKKDISNLQKHLFQWLSKKETAAYSSLAEVLADAKYQELQTVLSDFMASRYGNSYGNDKSADKRSDKSAENGAKLKATIKKLSTLDDKANPMASSINNKLEPLYK